MEMRSQLLAPAALLSGEIVLSTHWIGGWVGPGVGLDAVAKRKTSAPAENRSPVVQPIVSRHFADWNIQVQVCVRRNGSEILQETRKDALVA
jgi:hypothetical protein